MIIKPTFLDGVFEIENNQFEDQRGLFVKTFHAGEFEEHGLNSDFRESFYSVSKKNVLRGMHFQLPPNDHAKLVYVLHGSILDVVVDVRKKSSTFGQFYSKKLSFDNAQSLYMEKGFAHGFLALSETATVIYLTTTEHAPDSDTGIRWDSFGFNWQGINQPIISARDSRFPSLESL